MYPIEKGVPLPPIKFKGGRIGPARKFNWGGMEVGDSFFVPFETYGLAGKYTVATAASSQNQRSRKRWTVRTRTLEDHGEYGWRVWRIE